MADYVDNEHIQESERPVYKQSSMPWIFMLLMLPLFFIFGWIANEAFGTDTQGLIVGVGGGPNERNESIISPTPDSMMEEEQTVTPTQIPSVMPTPSVDPTGVQTTE